MLAHYNQLTQSGKIKADAAQAELARKLQELENALVKYAKKGLLSKLLAGKSAAPRGLFIHGKVGRGKSMMMDAFFKGLPVKGKIRRHFHEFMDEVHQRIHIFRQQGGGDPVKSTAKEISKDISILCLDEYEINDVTDAMILSKLFGQMIEDGIVLIFTSNKKPEDHYKEGLQRSAYLEFCRYLKSVADVASLDSKQDYRLLAESSNENYFTPLDYESTQKLKEKFKQLTGDKKIETIIVKVKGREIHLRSVNNVAYATFNELCAKALGAADYLAIAKKFDTLFLEGIPMMDEENRNEARRFINLVDVLYENRTKFICTAAAEPNDLYKGHSGGFEFIRTASRLTEMRA